MSVIEISGQANAAAVLRSLLVEQGLPTLSPEGIDALSEQFSSGLLIGNGVVSHHGKPLIDELRAIYANTENRHLFAASVDLPHPARTLTGKMVREVAANRHRSLPTDWKQTRSRMTGLTAQMMDEVAKSRLSGNSVR